jgi:Zn-dependent protease
MDGSIRIGSIFGIPVGIHYTWFAVLLLVTMNLVFFFGEESTYPNWGLFERIVVAVITSLLFFASVLVHEFAHSVVGLVTRESLLQMVRIRSDLVV